MKFTIEIRPDPEARLLPQMYEPGQNDDQALASFLQEHLRWFLPSAYTAGAVAVDVRPEGGGR